MQETYIKEDAECIFIGNLEAVKFDDDGVHVKKEFRTEQVLDWTPACDMDWPGAPNAQKAPSLPFPFTANELAAVMLDGVGSGLVDVYGLWDVGPDEEVLDSLGDRGRMAREALLGAYAAYRAAESVVGECDKTLDALVQQLGGEYQKNLQEANKKEHVHAKRFPRDEQGKLIPNVAGGKKYITDEEYWARRARAKASVADLLKALRAAQKQADQQWAKWRKAMVKQLLQPPQDASLVPTGGQHWPPERIAKVQAYRDAYGTGATAAYFNISTSLVKRKTASKNPRQKAANLNSVWGNRNTKG